MGPAAQATGRPMLPAEILSRYKRERIVAAIAELASEEGLAKVTATLISQRAKMAKQTFYEQFATRDAALEFSCAETAGRLAAPLREAGVAGGGDREPTERAVDALIAEVLEQPAYAALALTHSLSLGGGRADRHLEAVVTALAGAIGRGRLGELGARSIVWMVSMLLLRGESERLPEMRELLIGLAGV
jgi:AcrR family transcriptional regulator